MSTQMSTQMLSPLRSNRRIRERGSFGSSSDEQFKQIIGSWSMDTRYQIKQALTWKNQYNIADDIFCHLLNQLNEIEIESKEEEPSPFQETKTYSVASNKSSNIITTACLMANTPSNKTSQVTQVLTEDDDCKSVESDPDGILDDDFLNTLCQQQEQNVGDDDREKLSKLAATNNKPKKSTSNLDKTAPEFIPAKPTKKSPNTLGSIPEAEAIEEASKEPLTCNPPSPSVSSTAPLITTPPISTPSVSTDSSPVTVTSPPSDLINNIYTQNLNFLSTIPVPPTLTTSSVPNTMLNTALLVTSTPNISFTSVPNTNSLTYVPYIAPPLTSMPMMSAPQSIAQPAPNHVHIPQQNQSVLQNQFVADTQPMSSQPNDSNTALQQQQQYDDEKYIERMQNAINNVPTKPPTAGQYNSSQPKDLNFRPKFNNHAKGNFYISKEMISIMTQQAMEEFITDNVNMTDERLAFGYYKESVAMQINDGMIRINKCKDGKHRIIIDIDLHYKISGESMYLVAEENEEQFRQKVAWSITAFMSAQELYAKYGIGYAELPASSRNMEEFENALNNPPILSNYQIHRMLRYTNFRGLPKKTSKRKDETHQLPKRRISEKWLKKCCETSWNDTSAVPVVVIKGKNQWIEWKKFICIQHRYGQQDWIGISLRYHDSSKQWKIECMDYDAGRIYYQHRLVGLGNNERYNEYNRSYNELRGYVTCSLEIGY